MKFTPPEEPFVNKTASKTTRDVVVAQFQAGRTVNERFKILDMLGEGGMGMVFHATDLRLNRDAALKVPLPELLENPQIVKRFQREVALSTELAHPNIVRVHDLQVESQADILSFSMEHLEGKTLRQELLDTDCLKPDKMKEILETRGISSGFRGGSHLFLKVSEIRRDNDLQTNRRFPERGNMYDCRKTR